MISLCVAQGASWAAVEAQDCMGIDTCNAPSSESVTCSGPALSSSQSSVKDQDSSRAVMLKLPQAGRAVRRSSFNTVELCRCSFPTCKPQCIKSACRKFVECLYKGRGMLVQTGKAQTGTALHRRQLGAGAGTCSTCVTGRQKLLSDDITQLRTAKRCPVAGAQICSGGKPGTGLGHSGWMDLPIGQFWNCIWSISILLCHSTGRVASRAFK